MEAKPRFLLLSLVLALVLLLLQCPDNAAFRIGLTHVDSNNNNMALVEIIKRAVDRSKYRMELVQAKLSNSTFDVQAPIHFGDYNVAAYFMDLAIGTPPLPITAVMDTGSNLIWTQCQPCVQCVPQKTTIYDPSNSSTFSLIACATPLCQAFDASSICNSAGQCIYFYAYGDNSTTQGVLASETFTLGGSSVDNIGFGCGLKNTGIHNIGVVGLGQGVLSLPSQLNTAKFSYCLNMDSNSSLLLLGPSANLNGSSNGTVQSTPFLNDTTYYYIPLQGISLGATLLPIPKATFQQKTNGIGGTIIDSGTTLTYIQQQAYDILKQEIMSLVKLPVVEVNGIPVLCFQVTSWPPPDLPDMIFHFDGADMTVPQDNYMIADQQDGLLCVLILPTSFPFSILGNYLQQNMHILYDLDHRILSFVPAQCDQL